MKRITVITYLVLSLTAAAQTKDSAFKQIMRSDADLKSGNNQDVLASFLQLALKDLDDSRHFQFNSTLIGLTSRRDKSVLIDKNYRNKRFLRNSNLLIDLELEEKGTRIKDGSIGFKYAVVNQRDKTLFNSSIEFPTTDGYFDEKLSIAAHFYSLDIIAKYSNEEQKNIKDFLNGNEDIQYNELPDDFKKVFNEYLKTTKMYKTASPEKYNKVLQLVKDSLMKILENRLLITTAASYKFDPVIHFEAELLRGITNPLSSFGIEVNAKSTLDFIDSKKIPTNYNRKESESSLGLNIVYRQGGQPVAELKLAGSYKYIFSGLDPYEEKVKTTLEATLRVRITNTLWIPVVVKYDIKTQKLKPSINIVANF